MELNLFNYSLLGLFIIIIFYSLIKFKDTVNLLSELANDTLKKVDNHGKLHWSRTSLTMFSAWILVYYLAIYVTLKEGFKFDVFITLVGVSLGSKLTDSIGKKITNS